MTQFIILSQIDMLSLHNDRPVTIYIDNKPYILCTDEYFDKLIKKRLNEKRKVKEDEECQ